MDNKLGRYAATAQQLITYIEHRLGHDLRHAIDASKINRELGCKRPVTFELRVINDPIGSLTNFNDLANAILKILSTENLISRYFRLFKRRFVFWV